VEILIAKRREPLVKARKRPVTLVAKAVVDPLVPGVRPGSELYPGFIPRGGSQPILMAKEE